MLVSHIHYHVVQAYLLFVLTIRDAPHIAMYQFVDGSSQHKRYDCGKHWELEGLKQAAGE